MRWFFIGFAKLPNAIIFPVLLAPFSLLSFSGSWDVLAGALDGVLWVSEVLGIDLRYFFVLFL